MENKFSLDFFNLDGKVAIVTGGNTGLGMAYAEALAKAGADLLVTTFDDNIKEVKDFVNPATPCLLAVYGGTNFPPWKDSIEAIFIILPLFCSTIIFATFWIGSLQAFILSQEVDLSSRPL